MVVAVRADLHDLAAEGTGQGAVLALGIHDDNIVVGSERDIHNGGLHAHRLAGAGNTEIKSMGRGKQLAVTDNGILADLVDAVGQAAGVLDLLRPERDRYGAALRGESVQRVDAAQAVGQGGVQAVLLLKTRRRYIAKMLLADGNQTFCVGVQLFHAVGGMDDGNEGEDHALVVLRQIVHEAARVFPLLLHCAGNFGGKVVLAVLPLLPAGNVRLHAEDDRFNLFHGLVRRHRDHVDRQDQIAGILGQIGNEIVRQEGRIGAQEQDAPELVSKLEVIAFEADTVRADQITEVLTRSHKAVIVIVEILLIAGTEEVMQHTEPVIVSGRGDAGVQAGKGLLQICPGAAEIGLAFLDLPFGDGECHKAFLDKIVALRRPAFHNAVGFLPVVVEPVILVREKDTALKLCRVEPVVDNGDLGGGVGRHRIERPTVGAENALPRLLRGGYVVYICELPAPTVLVADLPNAVGVDALDRDALLDGARHLHFHALALVGGCKGFNQSLHAPFC